MYYPFSWLKSLARVALFLLGVLLVGWLVDEVFVVFLLGVIWLLLVQYWNMFRLNRWLWHSKKMTPPKAAGFWEHIYEGIYYLQRRNRNKRKQLSRLVKRFREGSEALPDAAVVVDANASIVWCNRLARIELGLSWPDDAGRRIDNLIRHPEFVEFFHSGEYDYPIDIPSPINAQKIFEYRIMPYGDKHLLLIVRDVTRLTQLEQMRKDFVANVSHELRTPLTVLNGYLEVIPGSIDSSDKFLQKAFFEMQQQSSRMQNLIEQLLVLSRIEASSERIFEKVVNVPVLLSTIKMEADSLNKEKQHTIEFEVDHELQIYGIETELQSAFSNLIFNAVHYTPEKGHIHVSWKQQDGLAKFAVKDNGDGIPENHLNRLTERFYRVDKARSRKTGGTGLGLSIVKHVLNHHNSQLNVTSTIGEGSVFAFDFSPELIAQQVSQNVIHETNS